MYAKLIGCPEVQGRTQKVKISNMKETYLTFLKVLEHVFLKEKLSYMKFQCNVGLEMWMKPCTVAYLIFPVKNDDVYNIEIIIRGKTKIQEWNMVLFEYFWNRSTWYPFRFLCKINGFYFIRSLT